VAAQPRQGPRTVFAAIGGELLLTALAFVIAGVIVSAIPHLRTGLEWLVVRAFGPPTLTPGQFRTVVAILLTPMATILAAVLHRQVARLMDDEPASPLPPPAPPLTSLAQTGLHLLLAVLGSYVLAVAMHLLGFPVAEQPLVVEISRGPTSSPEVGVLVVSALLLAPLGEELLFRGRLFRRVAARAGLTSAYATSALLFAAVHLNLQGFVIYAWLGLVFARVYMVTGRLGAAVAVHFGNNAVTLAALLFAPGLTPDGP
jgi:membrane protease YdiL (CAAX protease family)